MKKINKFIGKSVLFLGLCFFASSCDEAFLEEIPKDFLSPENAYTDLAGYESALTALSVNLRDYFNNNDWKYAGGNTDIGVMYSEGYYANVSPRNDNIATLWGMLYNIINNANNIISHAELDTKSWKTETEKLQIIAEARFFRGYVYMCLASFWGGVPIVKEAITYPKLDFVRSTRDETYRFAKEDLEFAATNLPDTDKEKSPGRVTKGAANHFLSEIDICLKDWDGAVSAASKVIDSGNYQLMTNRFGRRTNMNGDVYWDLFQMGNQNRSSGNKEAIWVIQVEYQTNGGGRNQQEKIWGPRYYNIKDPDGISGFVVSDELGRGAAWTSPSYYLSQEIWQHDWNDMRNSIYNIKREYYYTNPKSKYYGQKAAAKELMKADWYWYQPCFMKCTTPWDHPEGTVSSGYIYTDYYMARLAETYLLRAEAFLGKGDKAKAAADINVVRARANVTPVNASDVDIYYILDERARELNIEEWRACTLYRLGLLYERVKDKCNKILLADGSFRPYSNGGYVQPHHNLLPIPQTEIDLNGAAVLEQNPGY